jgi:hypothetical protein
LAAVVGSADLSNVAADVQRHCDSIPVSGVLRVVSRTGVSVNRCDFSPDADLW